MSHTVIIIDSKNLDEIRLLKQKITEKGDELSKLQFQLNQKTATIIENLLETRVNTLAFNSIKIGEQN